MIYNSLFSSVLQYGLLIWGSATMTNLNPLQILQNYAIRNVGSSLRGYRTDQLYKELKILKLDDLFKLQTSKFVFDFINGDVATSLKTTKYLRTRSEISGRPASARTDRTLEQEVVDGEWLNKFPPLRIPRQWNNIPEDLRRVPSFTIFKNRFTTITTNNYV